MKRSNIMNKRVVLLAPTCLIQVGLVLIFTMSGLEKAMAQATPSPVTLTPAAPMAPAASIDSTMPGAPAAAPTTFNSPAAQAVPAVPDSSTTVPAMQQQTLPAASKAEAASQPSAAELAIVNNAAKLNSSMPTQVMGQAAGQGTGQGNNGMKVTDILTSTPAEIRPLPKDYLIVKKDHGANDTDSRLTAARLALGQGNYQAALELFDDLYRKNPRDIRVCMGRAVALQKLGQIDLAMDAYQSALITDPHNIEALTNMLGLLKGKDAPTALKKLQQLRDLYPANADVTAQLGMAYGVSGNYTDALKYLNMADALKPGNPTILYDKAVAYDRMGNTVDAANLYRQILLLASDGSLDQSFPLEEVRQRLATLR